MNDFFTRPADWFYQPTPYDIAWTERHVLHGSDNPLTLWTVPLNNATYLIDRESKTATLLEGPEEWPRGNLFLQLAKVLAHFGWTVHHAPPGTLIPRKMREEMARARRIPSETNQPLSAEPPQVVITYQMRDDLFGKGKVIHRLDTPPHITPAQN